MQLYSIIFKYIQLHSIIFNNIQLYSIIFLLGSLPSLLSKSTKQKLFRKPESHKWRIYAIIVERNSKSCPV